MATKEELQNRVDELELQNALLRERVAAQNATPARVPDRASFGESEGDRQDRVERERQAALVVEQKRRAADLDDALTDALDTVPDDDAPPA